MRYFAFLAFVALAACGGTPDDEETSSTEESTDALTSSIKITKAGLVGTYISPRTSCRMWQSITFKADGTYSAKLCGMSSISPNAIEMNGTWTLSSRSLKLAMPDGTTPYTYQLSRAERLPQEPALDALAFKRGTSTFSLARKGPVDDVLAELKAGEVRNVRYEKGKGEGPSNFSNSAVVVNVRQGERATVRLEADYPMFVGSLSGAQWLENRKWRSAPYAGSPTFVKLNADQTHATQFNAAGVADLVLTGEGKHVVMFAAQIADGEPVHLRVSVGSDQASPLVADAFVASGSPKLIESDMFNQAFREAGANVSVAVDGNNLKLTTDYAPCRSRGWRGPLTLTLTPDGAGGFSGTSSRDKYSYASVRMIDGRVAVHMYLFDNFIQGSPHPYLDMRTCSKSLWGTLD